MAEMEEYYKVRGETRRMMYWQDMQIEAGSVYAMSRKASWLNVTGTLQDCPEVIRLLERAVQESHSKEEREDVSFQLSEMKGDIDPRISCTNLHNGSAHQ